MASADLITADKTSTIKEIAGDTYNFNIYTKEASVQLGEKNSIVFETPEGILKTINELRREIKNLKKSDQNRKLQLSLIKRSIDRVGVNVTVNRNAKRPKYKTDDDCHTNETDEEWGNWVDDGEYSNEEWEDGDGDGYYSNDEEDDENNVFCPDLNDIGEYAENDYDEVNGGGDDHDDDEDDNDDGEEREKEKKEDNGNEDMVRHIYDDFDDNDSDYEIYTNGPKPSSKCNGNRVAVVIN